MAMPEMHVAMAMPDMSGMAGKPGHLPAPAHDMPCGFGAITETVPPPEATTALHVPAHVIAISADLPPAMRSGSGLGTPPQPSTGPPATA